MSADFWISQTEYPPLPPISTAIYHGVLRMLPTKSSLPTNMAVMFGAMITDLAAFFGRERPTLVEEGDIEVRFHSHTMGKLGYNLEKAPAKATILAAERMLIPLGSIVVTLDVYSNDAPMDDECA
jgi:hypothetical protein